jgi:hypothetical protein
MRGSRRQDVRTRHRVKERGREVLCRFRLEKRRYAAAMARTLFGFVAAAALVVALVMPAVAAQAPAPAPATSDGESSRMHDRLDM